MRTIQRDIVGAFIFSADSKLLLGKNVKGGVYADTWVIPGGGIDEGETKEAALIREVLEETALDITDAQTEMMDEVLTGQSQKTLRDTGETVMVDMNFYNFKVTLTQNADEVTVHTEDDFEKAQWFPIEELASLTLSPPTILTLRTWGYIA